MDVHRHASKFSPNLIAAPQSWTPERLAAFVALAGVLISVFAGFHARAWQRSGSDFKTLYASAWCFARGIDAYNFDSIGKVFAINNVAPPHSWYAHAPVYPPFTLAIIALSTLLPMVPAVYAWIALSTAMVAAAAAALARMAGETFGLSRAWRLALIALFAACPLLSFGIEMGNVSVMVAALCIFASVPARTPNLWPRAAALSLALLLKPHMALWVLLALMLLPQRRGRSIARRTIAITAGAVCCVGLVMLATHQLNPQITSYLAMVHAETSGGSMDPASREIIAVPAEITSLSSLLGFWIHPPILAVVQAIVLLALATLLWRASRSEQAQSPAVRLELIGAWCAFGMLATYHRAHDGTALLLLLPWVLARLRVSWRDVPAWATIVFLAALSAGPQPLSFRWWAPTPALRATLDIIIYRQAPLAAALLMITLLGSALYDEVRQKQIALRPSKVITGEREREHIPSRPVVPIFASNMHSGPQTEDARRRTG
jgi:hypothetical protein